MLRKFTNQTTVGCLFWVTESLICSTDYFSWGVRQTSEDYSGYGTASSEVSSARTSRDSAELSREPIVVRYVYS